MRLADTRKQLGLRMALAAWLTLAGSAFAQSPLFPPLQFEAVPQGFNGTKFRGVGLGQTRQEVENALAERGFRCMTDAEIASEHSPTMTPQRIEEVGGYAVCRFTRIDNPTGIGLMGYGVEMIVGATIRGISFKNDIASVLSLTPMFFNSEGVSARTFANAIVDNYPFPDGLTAQQIGWSGVTAANELVEIRVSQDGSSILMIVRMAAESDVPSFD